MIEKEINVASNEAKSTKIKQLSKENLIQLVYNSLAFGKPDLKLEDVSDIFNYETKGKSSSLVQAVVNQKNAFNKAIELFDAGHSMTEDNLKDIHQLLSEGTNVIGGLYRNVNISIKGSNHTPCSHEKVYDRMHKYFNFLEAGPKGDALEYVAYSHLQLEKIHPFLDFNSRLARIVLNYQLLSHGFNPVVITEKERKDYFVVLETFKVEKNIVPFVEFLKKLQ